MATASRAAAASENATGTPSASNTVAVMNRVQAIDERGGCYGSLKRGRKFSIHAVLVLNRIAKNEAACDESQMRKHQQTSDWHAGVHPRHRNLQCGRGLKSRAPGVVDAFHHQRNKQH